MKSHRLTADQSRALLKLLQDVGPVYVLREISSFVLHSLIENDLYNANLLAGDIRKTANRLNDYQPPEKK